MDTRHQNYRVNAKIQYIRACNINSSIDDRINYFKCAIALLSQIENEYLIDCDRRALGLYYHDLGHLINNLNPKIESLQSAIRYTKKIKLKNPADEYNLATYRGELGDAYFGYKNEKAKSEYIKAITFISSLVKNNPDDKRYHRALAKLYAKIGDYKSAVSESEKVNSKETNDIVDLSNYYIMLGKQANADANYTNALAAYSKAIALLSTLDITWNSVRPVLENAASLKLACMNSIYQENKKAKASQNQSRDDNSSSSESESNLQKNSVFASTASTTAAPAPAKEKSRQTEQTQTKYKR